MNKALHADFIYRPATTKAQYAALITLAIISIPILLQISWSITIAFGFFWIIRLLMLYFKAPQLNKLALSGLSILFIVLIFILSKSVLGQDGGISFLLMMALLKSFESKHIRDWQVLLLATLFITAGSLLFSQNIVNAIWTVSCLFLVLTSLNILDGGKLSDASRYAARGMMYSLPLTIILFIAIPRLPEPLARFMPAAESSGTVGLSDTMEPGSFSKLVEDDELVFNAIFDDDFVPKNEQLYWRTLIMPHFDGHTWHMRQPFFHDDMPQRFPKQKAVGYELLVKDWQGYVPTLDYTIEGEERRTRIFHTATAMVWRRSSQLQRYHFTSVLSSRMPEELNPRLQQSYLELPERLNPQTISLAKSIYQDSVSSEDFILRTLDYFKKQGFIYTLEPPLLSGYENEVDEFMFSTKQGFCGHYASAMAVMMRAVGLPSRVVTGYQGGSYDDSAKFWQIRSKDAHAWTEVWLPETSEWARVDPTAAISNRSVSGINNSLPQGQFVGNSRIPLYLSKFAAKAQFYWQVLVVEYDAKEQSQLFSKLGLGRVSTSSILLLIIFGGMLSIIPMLIWWGIRMRRQSHPLSDGFMLMKKRLISDVDYVNSMGPLDLMNELQLSGRLNNQLKQLIDEYIELRFKTNTPAKKAVWSWYRRVKKYRYHS